MMRTQAPFAEPKDVHPYMVDATQAKRPSGSVEELGALLMQQSKGRSK